MTWLKTHIQTDTAFYILGYKYICVSSGVHVSSVPSDLRPVAGPGRSQGIWDSEPAPAPSLAALTLIEAKRFGLSRNFLVFLTLGSETQLSCTQQQLSRTILHITQLRADVGIKTVIITLFTRNQLIADHRSGHVVHWLWEREIYQLLHKESQTSHQRGYKFMTSPGDNNCHEHWPLTGPRPGDDYGGQGGLWQDRRPTGVRRLRQENSWQVSIKGTKQDCEKMLKDKTCW